MPNLRKPAEMRQRGRRTRDVGPVHAPGDAAVVPLPPAGLLKATREVWADFWQSAVSAAVDLRSDRHRLTRWIIYVDEWHRLAREIRKGERLSTGSTGQPVLSPLWAALAQVESALQKAEQDLGLGPLPRLKLGATIMEGRRQFRSMQELRDSLDRDDDESGDYVIIGEHGERIIDLDKLAPAPADVRRPSRTEPEEAIDLRDLR